MAEDLVAIAVELARRAGELVVRGRERAGADRSTLGVEAKSTPTDVVTAMDRASERFLTEQLRRLRPGDAVLGEEGGQHDGTTGVRWLVDPIDGTVNYLYGLPQYAVSVAAEVDGTVLAGAVHNPATGEMFRAVAGGGAWLSGPDGVERRLAVTGCTDLPQAMVATGFGYAVPERAAQAAVVAALLPRVRDIRRLGAASLDLCFLAAGRLDAYYERGLKPWDYAAGGLVAAEAGAVLSGLHGRAPGGALYAAAAPGVAAAFFSLLEELSAGPDGAPTAGSGA
jgi:myo-inositol-1(or 4)-monophosphatase